MNYWPWWAGALALGLITVGFPLVTGRTFGMSGAWSRVLMWRESREVDRMDAHLEVADLREALAAATVEQFGTSESASGSGSGSGSVLTAPPARPVPVPGPAATPTAQPPAAPPRPLPTVFAAVLLGSVFVGGLVASLTSGRFELRTDMGPAFAEIVTANPLWMCVVLFVGGVMVGFGTRMAGGCTSGHGLTGCSRLHPVSLVATATFFGTAVLVSFLVWKVL